MSTNPRIYLDFNATTPLLAAAREAMAAAFVVAGNPSSVHAEGRAARQLVEAARDQVAALAGRPREQVVFTSGGTEANRLGVARLAALAEARGMPRVVAADRTNHPSLAGAVAALVARGWRQVALGEPASVACVTYVNHELGTVTAPPAGDLVHVDAVQAAGKRPLPAGAASIAISAHKLGGPQGTGALIVAADEADADAEPDAGHQERGRRPGTENTLGIVGFGAAAAAARTADWTPVYALADHLAEGLARIGARVHPRETSTVNAAFPGARGESIVIALDLAGIAASTGAACTSGTIQPSPVLLALGQTPAQAREAVRFSLGLTTTRDQIDALLGLLPGIAERARAHTR